MRPASSIKRDMQKLAVVTIALITALAWSSGVSAQSWNTLATPPTFSPSTTLLLTDGTVLVYENNTSNWWKLTPKQYKMDYVDGTLAPVASFPASMNYAPWGFASAVLPDGRVIVEGGEYNHNVLDETTKGAIYDPIADSWTEVSPPSGWTQIGDASSVVLPDGTFMLANCCDFPAQAALLDEATLTWTVLTNTSGFVGKFDRNWEEGWTLLPSGGVLTVDCYVRVKKSKWGTNSEIYDPNTGVWESAGSTVNRLWDSDPGGCSKKITYEVGPALLRPDGTVFATGSNSCGAGHTAIYDTTSGVWTAGPDIPSGNDMADGPAAVAIDGTVLLDSNPGVNRKPSTFYMFDGTSFNSIPQPTGLNPVSSESARMLVLPSGHVLLTHSARKQMWFYAPAGTYQPAWQPTICGGCYPTTVSVGGTYTVSGTQFNGLTQGAYYGDEAQSATNYPLVVITNTQTAHKFFARTHSFSTMSVATGADTVSTDFDVLPGTEQGYSTLVVIANGIPSAAVDIIVNP